MCSKRQLGGRYILALQMFLWFVLADLAPASFRTFAHVPNSREHVRARYSQDEASSEIVRQDNLRCTSSGRIALAGKLLQWGFWIFKSTTESREQNKTITHKHFSDTPHGTSVPGTNLTHKLDKMANFLCTIKLK